MAVSVAVTGATGFIGRHVATALASDGFEVRCLTRRSGPFQVPGVEWVDGDLGKPESLAELVRGAELVVHLAGTVRGASQRDFDAVNVAGTAHLAEAALAAGDVRGFLLVSSLAAREPGLSWYAASKRRSEEVLAERIGDRIPYAIFRPTAVYGPGDREMRGFFLAMRRGLLPVLGRPDAKVSLVHVHDVVRAIAMWVARPPPITGTFELHDGTPDGYNWSRVAQIAEQIWGRPVHTLSVPRFALSTLARLNLTLSHLLGRSPMLTPAKVRELRHPDWRCDNGPLVSALGWEPRIDLASALDRGLVFES